MSDTPLTDKATFTLDNGMSGVLSVLNSEDMEALERQHIALIAKLEALAKEWSELDRVNIQSTEYTIGHEVGFNECGKELMHIIQEAKQ